MSNTPLETWAVPRLQQLLPLDDESLRQLIQYVATLSKDAAAEHLKSFLGDDAKALEFISSFNQRRKDAAATHSPAPSSLSASTRESAVPSTSVQTKKKQKKNIHALPPRQIEGQGQVTGGYQKREEEEYMPKRANQAGPRQSHKANVAENLALRDRRPPDATQLPLITDGTGITTSPTSTKPPPSAAGPLISDALAPRKGSSTTNSRTASPAPKAKVKITGGTAMHGASSNLSDLDGAIRSLELQTNPTLSTSSDADIAKRRCNCMATRHPLLDMAPNCLNCGNIICIKQGLGPCVFCQTPLMTADDINKVLRVLKDERGEAKMMEHNAAHKRADVVQGKARALTGREFLAQTTSNRPSPLSSAGPSTPTGSDDEATMKAKAHRDKLLGFQANNARRTRVHDEAADYDIPASGTNMWASPAERAAQLKKQQRALREMEWSARPEYEKRRVVASIDLKGGKVVRRMAAVEKPDFVADLESDDAQGYQPAAVPAAGQNGDGGGAFSHNPLAKGLIRPKAKEDKGKGAAIAEDRSRTKNTTWRRVQMDEDDNEAWILDGGIYGNGVPAERVPGDEPACG